MSAKFFCGPWGGSYIAAGVALRRHRHGLCCSDGLYGGTPLRNPPGEHQGPDQGNRSPICWQPRNTKRICMFQKACFLFFGSFFVGFHYFGAQQFCFGQASSGTPVKWQVTSREGLTVRVKSDLKSTKLGVLARHAVFEELDREGYRSWAERLGTRCKIRPDFSSQELAQQNYGTQLTCYLVGCNGVSSIVIDFPSDSNLRF